MSHLSSASCSTCGNAKARLHCGLCEVAICKDCANSCDSSDDYSSFALMPNAPAELLKPAFCHGCFSETVQPRLQHYLDVLSRAREIIVFGKSQTKETRLMKRNQKALHVAACPDRQETLMRLAYMAADAGFNGLIDVELHSKKTRQGSYQLTEWSGSGIPAHIDERRIPRDRSIWSNPN